MEKFLISILILLFVISIGSSRAFAGLMLFDWVLRVNDDIYQAPASYLGPDSGQLPAYFDDSEFDWSIGLGIITIDYDPGPGDYLFIGFFDHEIDEPINTFFNEYGLETGPVASGQSWEIDEPGYAYGDIYDNVLAGALDNSNGVPPGSEDDVSMALAWDFTLTAGETAMIQLIFAEETPSAPYLYLSHTDPDSGDYSIYYSGTLAIEGGAVPIPEPGTLILLGSFLLGLIGIKNKKNFKI